MADEVTDAWKLLDGKQSVPSEMLTADWARVPQWIRERQFYMAGVTRADILEDFRAQASAIVAGESNIPQATRELQAMLEATGYQPAPGEEGTIKDLRTARRIAVTLSTNVKLLQGWAKKERGLQGGAVRASPAWELIRLEGRRIPRAWLSLWEEAGGKLFGGRMIALKTDDIWRRLGTIFDDSIGVDYPPFCWGSGMGWRAVSRRECKALGLLDSIKPPATRPISSPNESLQVRAPKSSAIRAALGANLKGLAEFRDDLIVFTDPNGTRPYTADKLARIVTAELPAGLPQIQAQAVERHVNAGLMLGDLRDDFLRFARRTQPLADGTPVFRGEAYRTAAAIRDRLKGLLDDLGAAVTAIAESWTLNAEAAMAFAAGRGMKHRLILTTRRHGSLREIWQTAALVAPSSIGQKEVVALSGTRFRVVGKPSVTRVAGVVETRVEVEEVTA